jgi:hypothetical protein
VNGTLSTRNCSHRSGDSGRQSGCARVVPGVEGLVSGTTNHSRAGSAAGRLAGGAAVCRIYETGEIRTMRSMKTRIHRLQTLIPPVPPPKPRTEAERKLAATVGTLLERMDPAHARVVLDDLQRVGGDSDKGYRDFTVSVLIRARNHLKENQPLEFPAEVAAIYLSGEYSATTYECEDCGYDLPTKWPDRHADPPTPFRNYFERCPLCGGKVGGYAYYSKHGICKQQGALFARPVFPDAVEGQE